MSRRLGSLSGLGGGGGGGSVADLTPPATPTPQALAAGTTSLGSTLIGSWSAAVTVTATVTPSAGGAVTAAVTGSGAGPYSVSIASGLADGRSYAVRLRGTGADGQVADVVLSVAVGQLGTIQWVRAAFYDFTGCATSARVTSGTVTSGGGLPDWTLGTDSGSGFGVTPTAGQGLVLDNASTGRGFIHFTPDYAALGLDFLSPTPLAVVLHVAAPVLGASGFLTYQLGNASNPNGSGSGAGGRLINSGGTRNGNARSNSSGTSELSSSPIFTSASDIANVSFLGGFYPGENVNSVLNGVPAGTGPAGYTLWRDGATRAIGTGAGYSPGFVALLFGGGAVAGAIAGVEIWTRRVA